MTLGEPAASNETARRKFTAHLLGRWRSLAVVTTLSGILTTVVGIGLAEVFAKAAGNGEVATLRWIVWTWLILAGTCWTLAVLRSLRPPRRIVLPTILVAVMALCVGIPAGTWATFMVNHEAASGAQFDTTAATEFFLNAFSRYREELTTEGEFKILAGVDRKRRAAVLAQVRAVRAVLDAPAPGETPAPGQDWKRTRFDLVMAGKLSAPPGTVVFEVLAEETYPLDQFPWWGNAGIGGAPWTFVVRQDSDGGWWLTDFSHPDICAEYRRGHGCELKDRSLLPTPTVEPSPTPSPSSSGFNNWEFLPCGPRDPLGEFHNCPSPSGGHPNAR